MLKLGTPSLGRGCVCLCEQPISPLELLLMQGLQARLRARWRHHWAGGCMLERVSLAGQPLEQEAGLLASSPQRHSACLAPS